MKPVVITASDTVKFRRYAPDSVKFDDAKASSFAELKAGDELRALGERSADGTHFTPEEIVTGSFRMVAGTVTSVNAAAGEITIKNLQNSQPLTVVVNKDSMLRRVPPEMAQMLATFAQRRAAAQAAGPGAATSGTPAGAQPGQGGATSPDGQRRFPGAGGGPGGEGGGARMRGGDIQEMFEQRFTPITIADLKPGDAIAVSSTTGATPARVTAIRLAAGIEPLLQARPQGQSGPNRQSPSMALPGLDLGIGLP
jgi:hypothetical protein